MPLAIDHTAKTASSITLSLTGRTTGTYPNVEIQYSTRPDFSFVLSPIYTIATTSPHVMQKLNRSNTYFIRAREKTAAGVVQPWSNTIIVTTDAGTAWDTSPLSLLVAPALIVPPAPILQVLPTNVVAGRPGSNMLSDNPLEQCWLNSYVLDIETSREPLDTFALLETNMPSTATLTISAATTQVGLDTPAYDSGTMPFHASPNVPGRRGYHALARLPAPQSYRWWRFRFVSTELPPGGVVAITYLVAGLARVAKNIAADKAESPLDYGSIERLRDGTPDRRSGFRGRRVDFEIALMTEAQWETQFQQLRRLVGLTAPVLVVPNSMPGAMLHDRILYGPLSQNRVTQPYSARFSNQFSVESVI